MVGCSFPRKMLGKDKDLTCVTGEHVFEDNNRFQDGMDKKEVFRGSFGVLLLSTSHDIFLSANRPTTPSVASSLLTLVD
jgi:hypothetical protein